MYVLLLPPRSIVLGIASQFHWFDWEPWLMLPFRCCWPCAGTASAKSWAAQGGVTRSQSLTVVLPRFRPRSRTGHRRGGGQAPLAGGGGGGKLKFHRLHWDGRAPFHLFPQGGP